MSPEYYNTFTADLCHMTDVTDREILDHAVAEVTRIDDDEGQEMPDGGFKEMESRGVSLLDKAFQDNPKTAIGYIRLPIPVVNVNYLFGSKPILPKLLKMDRGDLENLTYYAARLVVSSADTSRFPVGSILTEYGRETQQALSDAHAETITGAEAVRFLMEAEGVENTGIIHEVIPVPPLDTRENKFKCEKTGTTAYSGRPLGKPFGSLVLRCNRVRRLMQLGAPEIILLNEGRILQEYADAIINNGARRGNIKLGYDGMPWYSLRNEYCRITRDNMDYITKVDLSGLPDDRVLALAEKIRNTDTDGFDAIENGTDGSYIDEDGEEHNTFDEHDPARSREAVGARYHEYMEDLSELKGLFKPSVEKFLQGKYPYFDEYFGAAEDKIGGAMEIWAGNHGKDSDFIRHSGYIISAVSYEFFTNGVPFYEVPDSNRETAGAEKNQKEGEEA